MKLLDSLHCNIVYYNEAKKTGFWPGIKRKRLEMREKQSKRETKAKDQCIVFIANIESVNFKDNFERSLF